MSSYTMDAFIQDATEIAGRDLSPEETAQAIAPLAERISAETDWVQDRYYEIDPEQGMGIHIVHGPDEGPFISTVCWEPGFMVLPHDHQTWACIVGIDGIERNIGWRRKDDGNRDGYAELEVAGELVMTKGVVCTMRPHEIHSVKNEGDRPSLSLHIYGKNLGKVARHEFDPDQNIVRPCPQRKRTA